LDIARQLTSAEEQLDAKQVALTPSSSVMLQEEEKRRQEKDLADLDRLVQKEREKERCIQTFLEREATRLARKNREQEAEQELTEIKKEVQQYLLNHPEETLVPGLVPHSSWDGTGWHSIGLYIFGFKRRNNCKNFPVLTKIVESIPTMTSAQISIVKPNSKLKPHIDDTSAVARIHLGIDIPDGLPNIGFRIACKEVDWREGELLILTPIRPHYA